MVSNNIALPNYDLDKVMMISSDSSNYNGQNQRVLIDDLSVTSQIFGQNHNNIMISNSQYYKEASEVYIYPQWTHSQYKS